VVIANVFQMAKRMKFSVIGLPHYTIWHLYEPSVDDLRHMEEMEQERLAREQEEKERADQKDSVQPKTQGVDHIVGSEIVQGSAEGPAAQPATETKDPRTGASNDQADKAEKVEKVEKSEKAKS
jgi:mannan polymerase II complex ANP1 subunit